MQKTDARPAAAAGESKLHFLDYWRVIRVRFGIVLLSFLLVVITAAVTTYFQPRKYRSSITMELRMPTDDAKVFKDTSNGMPGNDPRFAPTQFEIIQSKDVLYPVIDQLDLQKKWATEGSQQVPREYAYGKLRGMLGLKQIRGTELLQLDVTSTSPDEATKLVNAVAESYQEARKQRTLDINTTSVDALDGDLQVQRQKVNDLELKLQKMRKEHPEIRDTSPDSEIEHVDPFQAEVDARQSEVDKYTTSIAALKSQLGQVQQLKGDELMRALATLQINDPTIQQVLPKYQEAVSNEAALLNSGLGPNHPKIKSLVAARDVYTRQLTDQIESIKHSLSIQLEIQQKTLDSVTQQLTELREKQRVGRENSTEYDIVKQEYNKAQAILQSASMKGAETRMDLTMPVRPAVIWDKAEVPTAPSSPRVGLNMALGVLLGLIVGIGLAFFIEYLDTSVKTMEDVETMLGVPVLAIVPKNIKLLHKMPGDVPDAEAYRILRTNIEFNRKSADANTISMVSGGPGEGKSTTLSNLAFTCAQGGYSVLIVDADLRRPTQHKLFELNNAVGLTNYLTTNIPLEEVILPTGIENLSLMPSGILPADAVGILNSQRMSDMIAELKTRYDIIFFDSPPILGVSDGAVLASEVDQSIIIVQHRRFPRVMLLRVKQAISNVGGTVLGVVLNNVDLRHDPNYAYYTSYYEYYSVTNSKEARAIAASRATERPAGASSNGRGDNNGDSLEY
jgi:capsular exopolysaccharide synthesis family protein